MKDAPINLPPDGWVVINENGQPCHVAGWPEACHEHINDAINEHGLAEAKNWRVRPYILADRAAASAEPPQAIGWTCGCGHPNGINLANCAGCGRPPHDDKDWGPNPIGYIYPAAPSPAEPDAVDERTFLAIEQFRTLLQEGVDGFGRVLIATSDNEAVAEWRKRCAEALQAYPDAALKDSHGR